VKAVEDAGRSYIYWQTVQIFEERLREVGRETLPPFPDEQRVQHLMTPKWGNNHPVAGRDPVGNLIGLFVTVRRGSTKSQRWRHREQNGSRPALMEQVFDRRAAEGKALRLAESLQTPDRRPSLRSVFTGRYLRRLKGLQNDILGILKLAALEPLLNQRPDLGSCDLDGHLPPLLYYLRLT
jgi:hypothetical protein